MGFDLDLYNLFFDINEEQICPFHFDLYSSLRSGFHSDVDQKTEIVRLEGEVRNEPGFGTRISFKVIHSFITHGKMKFHCSVSRSVDIKRPDVLIVAKEAILNDLPDSFCISPTLLNLYMMHKDEIREHVMKNTFKLEIVYQLPYRLEINIIQ